MIDFKLSDDFVDSYRDKEVPWGYRDGAGNSLGEITYLRTYSRIMEDGKKETWVDTCRRVIEGMFTLQKRHCRTNHIEWKNDKAQRTAKDAFDRLFNMKWLPAGRGLWAMGSSLVMEDGNSAPLQSCAFISTDEGVTEAMTFLFDASMLGIGVGFDNKGAGKVSVREPQRGKTYSIPDSREGWVESLRILLNAYLSDGGSKDVLPTFDYSLIRPAGSPIKRFGGTASGPEPLKRMHQLISQILDKRIGSPLQMVDITDIGNIIGTCVVAGSTRRSAEIVFEDHDSESLEDFLNLKNPAKFPERAPWMWMSNNSVRVKVGDDFSAISEAVQVNGEPGLMWLDVAQKFGRLKDAPDYKDAQAKGGNPCLEQILFSGELCNLGEVFLGNCDDLDDLIKTIKVAYLYCKSVTLLPTKWERTNTIMQRNRRIGLSLSGVADFVDSHGLARLRDILEDGYHYTAKIDKTYSEWLCVRESIRRTTVKPSGSISLLAGSSPGVHWTPGGAHFIRRITFAKDNPIFKRLVDAGYTTESLDHDPGNAVVLFPIQSKSKRASSEVPAWEKIHLASEMQAWWSDNAVSCTVDFKPEEADDIPTLLAMYDGKLKGISFLPAIEGGAYKHMPYEAITADDYNAMREGLKRADFSIAYRNGEEAIGEKFCSTDFCEVEEEIAENGGGPKVEVPLLDLNSL